MIRRNWCCLLFTRILVFLYHRCSHSITRNTKWARPKLIKEDPFWMHTDDILGLSAGKHLEGIPQWSCGIRTINTCTYILTNSVRESLAGAAPLLKSDIFPKLRFIFSSMGSLVVLVLEKGNNSEESWATTICWVSLDPCNFQNCYLFKKKKDEMSKAHH
jgi:hypothetical protein